MQGKHLTTRIDSVQCTWKKLAAIHQNWANLYYNNSIGKMRTYYVHIDYNI